MEWCIIQVSEDFKERNETIDEVIKILNMRLRPETSPEIDSMRKDKRVVSMSDEQFDDLVSQGPVIE